MMKVEKFEFNMFGENTYLVYDEVSRECAIIDPGMMVARERQVVDNYIKNNDLSLKYLLLTHIHIDHVMGVSHIGSKYGIKVSASEADEFLGSRIAEQVQMFRLPVDVAKIHIENRLCDGDILHLGKERIEVISTPGHSPGGVCFYCSDSGIIFTGDTLFRRSIGRTDLPGGDYATLVSSVTRKLMDLPGDTVVYPGHDRATTISEESQFNPYI